MDSLLVSYYPANPYTPARISAYTSPIRRNLSCHQRSASCLDSWRKQSCSINHLKTVLRRHHAGPKAVGWYTSAELSCISAPMPQIQDSCFDEKARYCVGSYPVDLISMQPCHHPDTCVRSSMLSSTEFTDHVNAIFPCLRNKALCTETLHRKENFTFTVELSTATVRNGPKCNFSPRALSCPRLSFQVP